MPRRKRVWWPFCVVACLWSDAYLAHMPGARSGTQLCTIRVSTLAHTAWRTLRGFGRGGGERRARKRGAKLPEN